MTRRCTWFTIAVLLVSTPLSRGDITSRLVPPFVLDLAATAFAKLPRDTQTKDEGQFRALFGFGFLEGFLSPDGESGSRMPRGFLLGDQAGRAYRRAHPEKLAWVLREYGYVEVECEGIAVTGHEIAQFEPMESKYPGPWRLDSLGASWPEDEETARGRLRKRKVSAKGFLSPFYDDIGDCKRVLLFTRMEAKKS